MKPFTTRRFTPSRFTFALVVLAFSVFGWGLQYKLSLYDPPQAPSHQMPSAKLLSKEEQAIPADSSLVESVKGSAKAMQGILSAMSLGLLATLLFLSRELQAILASQATLRASKRPFCSKSRIDRSVTAFFFRPPPILS